jgi:CTP:molybdopterin cytidylyltransferase MocA
MATELNSFPVILLAAGSAKRMGIPKGLLEYHNETWLAHQLKTLKAIGIKECVVVLGDHKELYFGNFPILKDGLGEPQIFDSGLNLACVVNPYPELGPFSSMLCAVRYLIHVAKKIEGVFVLPIDTPCASKDVWLKLAPELKQNAALKACVPQFKTHGGHPVLLSPAFAQQMLAITADAPDARLDKQIELLGKNQKIRLPVDDPLVAVNINTQSDWNDFLEFQKTGMLSCLKSLST